MHGCGNDYVYINSFDLDVKSPKSLAISLSNRHTGIGSDGLVLILRSKVANARMRMFNTDGSEGDMCGNAIRCVAKYLYDNRMVQKLSMQIETKSGIKKLYLSVKNGLVSSVKVDMGPACDIAATSVIIDGKKYEITCVSMGNPHAVTFGKKIDEIDLHKIGPLFEHNPVFPGGVNTEFIEVVRRNVLKMRVWERGSGETQACGTGACASAVASVLKGYCDKNKDIKVQLPGGTLTVKYTDEAVFMTGSCVKVFEGVVEL